MSRILKTLSYLKHNKFLLVTLMLTCLFGQCYHIHDANCDYNPNTDSGCTHQCVEISTLDNKDPNE